MNSAKKLLLFSLLFISVFNNQAKAQTEGDAFFGAAIVHDIQMTFTQTNYWDSLVAYMPLEQYLKGDITIDGTLYANVGVKFKGNSSYSNPSTKKPFKIDMNEFVAGQDVDGLKKFNLNNGFKDPSFMREKVALDFYQEHNIDAPRCSYSRVSINGVYWGLYMFVEECDKTFLDDDDHFGNKQGNLFKGDPQGSLQYLGSTISSYYPKYELHTNTTANDWTDLYEFINKINNSGSNFHDSLETILNTPKFIQQWAAVNLFVNLDSYIGSGHNYFIYHDTVIDKFQWIGWDVNESFGNFNMGMTSTQLKNLSMFYVSSPATARPLVNNMLADASYKQELINTFCNWIYYDFSNTYLDPKIDSLSNAIRADVYADTKKFYSNADFDNNLTSDVGMIMGVKSFITARRAAIIAELATNGCLNIGVAENQEGNQALIYPNPATDMITIEFPNQNSENQFSLYTITGQKISEKQSSNKIEKIDVSNLSNGLYIIKVNENSYFKIQKIN